MNTRPLLLTMGDASGIGPEIIVKAVADGDADGCLVVGDPAVLGRAARVLGLLQPLALVESPADLASVPPGALAVLRAPGLPAGLADLPWGRVDARCGAAAAACIEAAARLLAGRPGGGHGDRAAAQGSAGRCRYRHPGHTEMLQALAAAPGGATPPVRMMLANDELRVVLVSIHVALRRAVDLVNFDSVLQTIRIAHASAAAGARRDRASRWPGSTRMPAKAGCSATRSCASSRRRSRRRVPKASTRSGPFAPDTVFMRARHAPGIRASSTWWWR